MLLYFKGLYIAQLDKYAWLGLIFKLNLLDYFTIILINMYTYKIHLNKETEGGITVSVPALPGCITYGEDVGEAISMT